MMIRGSKFLTILLLSCALAAQTMGPERTVQGTVITSERDPKVRLRLPESAHYVGADRWILYNIAELRVVRVRGGGCGKERAAAVLGAVRGVRSVKA